MNARILLVVPVALGVGLLSACGGGVPGEGEGAGSGGNQVKMPASVCAESAYIRDRMPEGYCDGTDSRTTPRPAPSLPPADDDLSPLTGR